MLKYLVIAIFILAAVAKGLEIWGSIQMSMARKTRNKNKSKNNYKKSYANSGSRAAAKPSFHSDFSSKSGNSSKAERGSSFLSSGADVLTSSFQGGSDKGFMDFSHMNDMAHENAVRMHEESDRIHRSIQEETVRMNDLEFSHNANFAAEQAVVDHNFAASAAEFDSMSMHDTAINDSAFLNDMACGSFDSGFDSFSCGGFGMF